MADWNALAEDSSVHVELQEGVLIVSPRPLLPHARAVNRIWRQLDDQLPAGLEAITEFEVCVDAGPLPTIRIPDIVIARPGDAVNRLAANAVLVAIEVISPGSRKTDLITKRVEYSDAGIQHYWVVDLEPPVTLTAFHQAGEFGYQESPSATGVFATKSPVPMQILLDGLIAPR
ncbi:Uma2 family endonuclease [Hoyosella altamirensis]|nr:Uma2 family endonuclease [Hoyosella altamirensis]